MNGYEIYKHTIAHKLLYLHSNMANNTNTNNTQPQIKVTKLNNYEENYQHRVEEARHQEVKELRKELFVWALSLMVTVISPSLATGATFIAYALIDESHILTASTSFTVLLLFNALRFPINYFGRLLGRLAQALTSMERIASFLDRELRSRESSENDKLPSFEKKEKTSGHETVTEARHPIVGVRNASFRIGSQVSHGESSLPSEMLSTSRHQENGFEVSGIDFSLHRGEILALVGAVGSGKSTIINGLIAELPMAEGASLSLDGKLALVSQSAYILNRSLRDNILFGEPFEQERYEQVLETCCLWPDIELLGEAGDLTEIGKWRRCAFP